MDFPEPKPADQQPNLNPIELKLAAQLYNLLKLYNGGQGMMRLTISILEDGIWHIEHSEYSGLGRTGGYGKSESLAEALEMMLNNEG